MCKAFSCIVHKNGLNVYWKAGVDSHDQLIEQFKLGSLDTRTDKSELAFARVEIIPDNDKRYPYLWPELPWKLIIDERVKPTWWMPNHEAIALSAHQSWKTVIYDGFSYTEAREPLNPLAKKHKPTKADIALLKEWASVRDSVGASVRASVWDSVGASVWDSVWASVWDSVWDSVRDSVRDSVWASVRDSVRAYSGSLFPKIQWPNNKYPYDAANKLWRRGFLPSFDGTTWRLHSGPKAEIVYEWKPNADHSQRPQR